MENMTHIVRVGFGVFILHDGKVLLGRRHEDPTKADSELHGEGTWTMPGGKIEFGESFEDAVKREVKEETSMSVESFELMSVMNDRVPDAHFVTLGFLCNDFKGEARAMEPDEITEWRWFDLRDLPKPLFRPSEEIIEKYLKEDSYKGIFSDLNPVSYKQYYKEGMKTVFTTIPNSLFYLRSDISSFVLKQGASPTNPYMNFDYNIFNSVPKKEVRIAVNSIVQGVDEVWGFAENFYGLTDGVLWELSYARELGKPVRYFVMPTFEERFFKDEEKPMLVGNDYYGYQLKDQKWGLVFTAMSSKLFYFRTFISKFVLEHQRVPLNPFMLFDYFIADRVERLAVHYSNFRHIELAQELWIFGPASDGVRAEIVFAKDRKMPIRYFKVQKPNTITEISEKELEIEE